jgi:hypothetical protein
MSALETHIRTELSLPEAIRPVGHFAPDDAISPEEYPDYTKSVSGAETAAGYEITATEEDEPDAAGQADEAAPPAAGGGAGGGGDITGPPVTPGGEVPAADDDPEPHPEVPPEVLAAASVMIDRHEAPIEPQDYGAAAQRIGELLVEQDRARDALRKEAAEDSAQGAARDMIATQQVPLEDASDRIKREAQVGELLAEQDTVREALRAGGGDDNFEPADRPEAPVEPEIRSDSGMPPTLEIGAVVRYQDGELQEGADPDYFDPEMPEVAYAPADSVVLARGGFGEEALAVNASSEGGRIVTLHNSQTFELAVVHVGIEDIGTTTGEQLIQTTMDAAPSLAWSGVQAHVLGDVETSPLGEEAGRWNQRLEAFLRGKGINDVTVVSEGAGKDVYAYPTTGEVEAFSATGVRIYPPETPEVRALQERRAQQSLEARPDNAEPTET